MDVNKFSNIHLIVSDICKLNIHKKKPERDETERDETERETILGIDIWVHPEYCVAKNIFN
jgi:hypothetical protein